MDPVAAMSPDSVAMAANGFNMLGFLIENGMLIGFILTTILGFFAQRGNKAIAAVEQVKQGIDLPSDQAKILAVRLFRKYLPFIPEMLASAIIQFLFDKMQKAVEQAAKSPEVKAAPATK